MASQIYMQHQPLPNSPGYPPSIPYNLTFMTQEAQQAIALFVSEVVAEIQNYANQTTPRTFAFNVLAKDGYQNEEFRQIVQQTLSLAEIRMINQGGSFEGIANATITEFVRAYIGYLWSTRGFQTGIALSQQDHANVAMTMRHYNQLCQELTTSLQARRHAQQNAALVTNPTNPPAPTRYATPQPMSAAPAYPAYPAQPVQQAVYQQAQQYDVYGRPLPQTTYIAPQQQAYGARPMYPNQTAPAQPVQQGAPMYGAPPARNTLGNTSVTGGQPMWAKPVQHGNDTPVNTGTQYSRYQQPTPQVQETGQSMYPQSSTPLQLEQPIDPLTLKMEAVRRRQEKERQEQLQQQYMQHQAPAVQYQAPINTQPDPYQPINHTIIPQQGAQAASVLSLSMDGPTDVPNATLGELSPNFIQERQVLEGTIPAIQPVSMSFEEYTGAAEQSVPAVQPEPVFDPTTLPQVNPQVTPEEAVEENDEINMLDSLGDNIPVSIADTARRAQNRKINPDGTYRFDPALGESRIAFLKKLEKENPVVDYNDPTTIKDVYQPPKGWDDDTNGLWMQVWPRIQRCDLVYDPVKKVYRQVITNDLAAIEKEYLIMQNIKLNEEQHMLPWTLGAENLDASRKEAALSQASDTLADPDADLEDIRFVTAQAKSEGEDIYGQPNFVVSTLLDDSVASICAAVQDHVDAAEEPQVVGVYPYAKFMNFATRHDHTKAMHALYACKDLPEREALQGVADWFTEYGETLSPRLARHLRDEFTTQTNTLLKHILGLDVTVDDITADYDELIDYLTQDKGTLWVEQTFLRIMKARIEAVLSVPTREWVRVWFEDETAPDMSAEDYFFSHSFKEDGITLSEYGFVINIDIQSSNLGLDRDLVKAGYHLVTRGIEDRDPLSHLLEGIYSKINVHDAAHIYIVFSDGKTYECVRNGYNREAFTLVETILR